MSAITFPTYALEFAVSSRPNALPSTDIEEAVQACARAHHQFLDALNQAEGDIAEASENPDPVAEADMRRLWDGLCLGLRQLKLFSGQLDLSRPVVRRVVRSYLREEITRSGEVMRTLWVTWPELAFDVPSDLAAEVWTIRIPPVAYLRAMANLFWSAVRHPLSDTTLDLSTGRVLYRN